MRWDPTRVAGRNEQSGHHRHPEKPGTENKKTLKKARRKSKRCHRSFLSYLMSHSVVRVGQTAMTPLAKEAQLDPLDHSLLLKHILT